MNTRILPASALALLAGAAPALAHTGVGDTHGFAHGFLHPLGGLDHILAMVAVGLFAAHLGGRALWLVPATFVTIMAAGGVLGMAGVAIPFVESGIALSVIVLGLVLALRISLPLSAATGLVGFCAVFHGHAHGAEMPADASGLGYALGFMAATATLHALGVALAASGKLAAGQAARIGGGVIALTGVGLLAGWL